MFPEAFLFEAVPNFAVIDAKELRHPCGHVDIVLLAFRTLLVHELVDRIILRLELQQDRHDDKKRLAKIGRTALAAGLAVGNLVAGIVLDRVSAREANQRLLMYETAKIADFSHQLRPHGLADTSHGHDGFVLRELGSQAIHLGAVGFHRAGNSVDLGNRFSDQELAGIRNIRTKSLGSNNKQNVVYATINGLAQLKTPEEVAAKRGKSVAEVTA